MSQSEWPNTFELSHGSLQGTGWYCIGTIYGILSCRSHHLLVKCPIFPISAAASYFPRILEASRDPGLSFESEKSWFKAAKLSRGVQECHTTASVEHQLLRFDQIFRRLVFALEAPLGVKVRAKSCPQSKEIVGQG